MPHGIDIGLIDRITPLARELVTSCARSLPHLRYADIRIDVSEGKRASAENGSPRSSGDDYGFPFGVRVLAAYRRATANAELKADVRGKFGSLGEALADTRLCPVAVRQEIVPATFRIDPRGMGLDAIVRFTADISRQVAAAHGHVRHNHASTVTQLDRELIASSEGALIDQSFALTQGLSYVVVAGDGPRLGRLYHDGGIMADSRDYLMKVDAVGTDFQIHPIPNCGKGQPMQSKKLGNGGPTMRSRAILTGGRE